MRPSLYPMNHSFDTVYAPSSAVGGAICVIRVSGRDTRAVVRAILDAPVCETPNLLRRASILQNGAAVDDCMAVFFKAPKSYTGEDMLELHCHGGIQTVRTVLETLSLAGAVPAEPGAFTKRAFLNGKMDLSQAEAVMDVINAQSQSGLRVALEQLGGSVSRRIRYAEDLLLDVRAAIEAAIDYPDEAEIDSACIGTLSDAEAELCALIEEGRRGRVLRDGLKIAILGRPNVGKSSLLNALLGQDRAIVTAAAGTTRDVLDEQTVIEGVPVRLIDTAGLREAVDEAERIGVERAKNAMDAADALLIVLDGSVPETAEETALLAQTAQRKRIVVANKCDLGTVTHADLAISCRTGEGLGELKTRIAAFAESAGQSTVCITNERHIRALELAREAVSHAGTQQEPDCIATDVQEALHQLGTITGTDVDAEVVNRIFQNFCVGK